MTSPWSSVLTSSPGMTTRSRVRASSTASSAPPKTLWSVTAMPPSPIASAWSSRSSVGIEQSCDHSVCRWRSSVIQSRSASGSSGSLRGARRLRDELRVDGVELGSDRLEALALRALAGVEGCAGAGAGVGDETLDLALCSVDRSVDGCGLARRRLECESLLSARRRDEDRRAGERLRPLRARARGADVHARAQPARYRRAKAERLRVEQGGLPVGRALEEPEKSACRRAAGGLELDRDEVALRGRAGIASGPRRGE